MVLHSNLRLNFKLLTILIAFIITSPGHSKTNLANKNNFKFKTFFGNCPSRSAGKLTLKLVQEIENGKSLREIKSQISDEGLKEKYFLSDYKIKKDPLYKFLSIEFKCPSPLMKVQVYKNNGKQSYSAILVENGKLYDPTYEVLLRTEGKLVHELPSLALPLSEIDGQKQYEIADVINNFPEDFRKLVSEVILNKTNKMTLILSIDGHPSSVFIGEYQWQEKLKKLRKIISYMREKKQIPSVINLTNAKKVVVKFSDNI